MSARPSCSLCCDGVVVATIEGHEVCTKCLDAIREGVPYADTEPPPPGESDTVLLEVALLELAPDAERATETREFLDAQNQLWLARNGSAR